MASHESWRHLRVVGLNPLERVPLNRWLERPCHGWEMWPGRTWGEGEEARCLVHRELGTHIIVVDFATRDF